MNQININMKNLDVQFEVVNAVRVTLETIVRRLFPKKYYWFQVRFIYSVDSRKLFDFVTEVGLESKETILQKRRIKKLTKPVHLREGIPKYMLKNGTFAVEVISYLGRFKNA